MTTQRISIKRLHPNEGQIPGLPSNPRQWTQTEIDKIAKSLKETPELFEARPVIVMPFQGEYVILGGNLRYEGCKKNKEKDLPCFVLPETTSVEKMKEIVIKDNGAFGGWDYDALANEWDDLALTDWGVPTWDTEQEAGMTESEIERKEREFREKMEAGEISEEDEEYQAFLEKFKLKKTTDDCYTPPVVYDAVADWVVQEYGLEREEFIRPFYPGGDYQNEKYPAGCVVVDNPPFSILSEILRFYNDRGIKYFLFAPTLTLFSSSLSSCTALPVGVGVTYENGASVNTSFLTNLEDQALRFRSVPGLYLVVKKANDINLKELHKELPKYSYDHHIVTSSFVGQLSRLGIAFQVSVKESEPISQLECQKESGKAIYGKGYIVSEQVFAEREKAEREKAEREKAEREKAERWELSDKERAIVEKLTIQGGRPIPAE